MSSENDSEPCLYWLEWDFEVWASADDYVLSYLQRVFPASLSWAKHSEIEVMNDKNLQYTACHASQNRITPEQLTAH